MTSTRTTDTLRDEPFVLSEPYSRTTIVTEEKYKALMDCLIKVCPASRISYDTVETTYSFDARGNQTVVTNDKNLEVAAKGITDPVLANFLENILNQTAEVQN